MGTYYSGVQTPEPPHCRMRGSKATHLSPKKQARMEERAASPSALRWKATLRPIQPSIRTGPALSWHPQKSPIPSVRLETAELAVRRSRRTPPQQARVLSTRDGDRPE